jgi:hypothetical protein
VATKNYMLGRVRLQRPQGLLFSNDAGTLDDGIFVPQGTVENQDFIILTDHNRSEISLSNNRLENRLRTINGTMRSYHTADKLNLSVSWSMVPSRSYASDPTYNSGGAYTGTAEEYTADGGAGGVEMLEWYEDHPGPFYVYLAYDKYTNFNDNRYEHLNQYSQVLHMYFSSFDYTISKRGSTNHDLWNVTMSLEEV